MKISIITVVYNAADTIEHAIKSVLSQSYKNIEYIIIDGGSTDGTLAVIKKYRNKLAYFVSEPDDGIYDAMNKGIQKSTGDVIGLLNADDWYEPNAIQNVISAFEVSNSDVVYGKVYLINKNGKKRIPESMTLDNLFFGMVIHHPAVFVRKSVYDIYGLFDTSFRIAADHEFVLRLYVNGVSFFAIDDILTNFSLEGISSTACVKTALEDFEVCTRYQFKSPNIDFVRGKMLQKVKFAKSIELCEKQPQLFLNYIESIFKNNKIAVWGTGIWGQRIYDILFRNDMKVSFFLDSNESKWNTIFNGLPVRAPESLTSFDGIVFIAVKDYDTDIANLLKSIESIHLILLRDFADACAKLYDENDSKIKL